jgi:hypothetical protein
MKMPKGREYHVPRSRYGGYTQEVCLLWIGEYIEDLEDPPDDDNDDAQAAFCPGSWTGDPA